MAKRKDVDQDDAQALREYLERANLTPKEAAERLGLTDRMVRYYCAGDVRIPQVVWLALETVTKGRRHAVAAR